MPIPDENPFGDRDSGRSASSPISSGGSEYFSPGLGSGNSGGGCGCLIAIILIGLIGYVIYRFVS